MSSVMNVNSGSLDLKERGEQHTIEVPFICTTAQLITFRSLLSFVLSFDSSLVVLTVCAAGPMTDPKVR